MESDKYICVREVPSSSSSSAAQPQVAIIDTSNPSNVIRKPIKADSAIMHPSALIIALKSGRVLQIFNLELKEKIVQYVMDEDVVFWKWISESHVGMVTETSVYHWNMDGSSPRKIFSRLKSLEGCQIINYRVNGSMSWMVLIGIMAKDGRVVGAMQLYSVQKDISQPIEGHAAAFGELTIDGHIVQLFTLAVRMSNGSGKASKITYQIHI